jgi:hypothetical protein
MSDFFDYSGNSDMIGLTGDLTGESVMYKTADIAGDRFGRLIALRYDGDGKWLCQCDCGKRIRAITTNLTRGNTKSCGCLHSEVVLKHGMANTSTYRIWVSMRARCRNPNDAAYANYGGRGIDVCERWEKFANFIADMGLRPAKHQIDRIDNDLGYSPENCRWVTAKANLNNKRTSHKIEWQGETLTVSQWAERLGINQRTLFNRLGRGWPLERAMTAPIAHRMQ